MVNMGTQISTALSEFSLNLNLFHYAMAKNFLGFVYNLLAL